MGCDSHFTRPKPTPWCSEPSCFDIFFSAACSTRWSRISSPPLTNHFIRTSTATSYRSIPSWPNTSQPASCIEPANGNTRRPRFEQIPTCPNPRRPRFDVIWTWSKARRRGFGQVSTCLTASSTKLTSWSQPALRVVNHALWQVRMWSKRRHRGIRQVARSSKSRRRISGQLVRWVPQAAASTMAFFELRRHLRPICRVHRNNQKSGPPNRRAGLD